MSEEKKEVLLELRGIKTFFPVRSGFFNKVTDYVQAVNNVDLDIYRGETLGLVGESGCGKTTLGKSIIQLVHATNGTMMYDFGEEGGKKDLRKLSKQDEQLLHQKVQIVFQDPYSSLNPSFTIFQSLADPLSHYGIKDKEKQRKIIGDCWKRSICAGSTWIAIPMSSLAVSVSVLALPVHCASIRRW